uniref:DUF4378 domain-containing protein n=1 Tax=Davidia involucrata TaxID=16924 RepID=A0A5B6Z2R2_DAVIN
MNDTAGKTASSLAITEKKPHRPGGCVGIFFQLFDWNRRFAKKKLFSKKLLPPARAKQASKKFGGDDKLPKLRLIADENSGGFPNVKKNGTRYFDSEQKHKMQAPSLVARLMGLESMPPAQQDKLKKASFSEFGSDRGEKFVSNHSGFSKEDLNLEKGNSKHELRPEKLQKTGPFERRPVTRFGAEALHFKSVLSRSRKHHPKLASPVKSPRMLSGRHASRLIDAATKMLEPGLQARNRAKCALTYSNTMHHAPKDDIMMEGKLAPSSLNSNYYSSAAKSMKGQSSCKNCDNLLDFVDSRPNVEEQTSVFGSPVSSYVNPSSYGSERSKPRQPVSSPKEEQEQVLQKSQEQSISLASQARNDIRTRAEPITNRRPLNQGSQVQCQMTSQQCKSQRDVPSSTGFKHKSQSQIQMSLGRDRVPPRSKLSNLHTNRVSSAASAHNETKNFVALNRSLSGRTRSRMPAKMENCKFDAERKSCNRRDESLSPVRKRRSAIVNRQCESSGFVSSTFGKQRNYRCDVVIGKGMGLDARCMNNTCIESRSAHPGESNRSGSKKDNDVISFTFSSPMKHKTGILTEMEEKRRDQNDVTCNSTLEKNSVLDDSDARTSFQKPLPLRGDALGALLEQKMKELTCQEEDELATGGTPSKRTTAMILQELISALTAESPVSQDNVTVESNWKNVPCYSGDKLNTDITIQAKTKMAGASVGCSRDCDHLSPGSVLEASFSNDSCVSSSLDDNSGHRLHSDPMDCSYDESQPLEPDADLLDSATSLSKGGSRSELVTDLLNYISEVLYGINLAGARLKGSQLAHAKEVIMNAELVFGNGALHNSDGMGDFSVTCFLFNELETLASVIWTNCSCFLGFENTKEGNQLCGFPLDCVIEYLDSRYGRYSKSGFKAWTRLPLCMNAEMLIHEVVEEVRRWADLAGLIPDELIEKEMSYSLGKWTDFEIEAFEIGAEIGGDILQILVDEIVVDLWDDRLGCSGISYRPC